MTNAATPSGDAAAALAGFEHSPSMIFVVQGDDLRVTAANAAMRAGFARDEMMGLPIREAFPEVEGQRAYEFYERVMQTGEPLEHSEFRFEVGRGTPEVVEVYLDFTMNPLHDAEGRVDGVVCEVRDATERVRARKAVEARAARAERRYAEAIDVVQTLQDTMLPDGVPILPRVQTAATYLLADSETTAGGDWFDTMPLPRGRWAFVVGDVVGHGVAASATMGRLRAALRASLSVHDDPAGALEVLDRYVQTDDDAFATTVVVAVLDPETGDLEYCTAGHPPPLLVPATGEARFLPLTGAGPLGSGTGFATARETLVEGDLLMLYSDGIIERPGRSVMENQVELLEVVADIVRHRPWRIDAPTAEIENVCRTALEMLVRETGHEDDVTLLAVQRQEELPRLALSEPVEPTTVTRTRAALRDWLNDLGVRNLDLLVLLHAVGELTTNVVDHAYLGTRADPVVEVGGRLTHDGAVELSVRDYGRWRSVPEVDDDVSEEAGRNTRGRGLAMARGMVDTLTVEHSTSGTTARLRHRVERPVALHSSVALRPTPHGRPEVLEVRRGSEGVLEVAGAVDAVAAERLNAQLLQVSRGGVRPLIVDLSNVSHLSSAGIRVLLEYLRGTPETRLRAPAGSVAQHVLSIVQVEHEEAPSLG